MTTIAYKSGVLACDKQATSGSTKARAAVKMHRTDTHAYAITGNLANGLMFLDQVLRNVDPFERVELKETTIMQMDLETGDAGTWEEPGWFVPIEDKIAAIGSGGDIALGAMAAGAEPEAAVRIAATWDAGTGFGVQVAVSARAERRLRRKQKV